MIFRIYHEKRGGHIHMAVFSGKTSGALGKCGDLCMREEEFKEFRQHMNSHVELVEVKDEKRETPK